MWSNSAVADLERLGEFLRPAGDKAVAECLVNIQRRAQGIEHFPRLGERLAVYQPAEVRRIMFEGYELRYAIHDHAIFVLRVWHTRESR